MFETMLINGEEMTFFATGTVIATLVNPKMERAKRKALRPPSKSVHRLTVSIGGGVWYDSHSGTRTSDVRELKTCGMQRKSSVLNYRQFSAISFEEAVEMARLLNLPEIPQGALGENLIFTGIPCLTQLEKNALLHFWNPNGEKRDAILSVWSENKPCPHPGAVMHQHFFQERADLPKAFDDLKLLPVGKRGIVGQVFAGGHIYPGDIVRVQSFIPK